MLKKIMIIAIISGIIIVLAGCGGEKKASGSREISVVVYDRGLVSSDEGTYENNRITKFINENSGVTVKFVPVPRNQAQQKMNMLIASGSAPDVLAEFDRTFMGKLVNEGVIMPVDKLIQENSVYYKQYLEENQELKPYVVFDNKMYAFTSKRGANSIANHGISIRQDWLNKLGLSAPKTDKELLAVAKAFTDNDPDGDGKNDTYGFSFNSASLPIMDAMYQTSSIWYLNDNNQLEFGMVSGRKKDMLQFAKTVYEQGSIDKEFFADKNNVKAKQQWITGEAGIYFNNYYAAETRELYVNNPNAEVAPLEAVSTKYGKNGLWQEAPPNMFAMISNTCKNPEDAVKYLDWMLEKGWFNIVYGEEGVHYNLVKGMPKSIDPEKNKKEIGYSVDYAIMNQRDVTPEMMTLQAADDVLSQKLAKLNGDAMLTALKTPMRRDIPYDPTIPEVSQIWAEFKPIVDEVVVKVMLGSDGLTPESGYAKLVDEWNRLGGENVTKLANEWYQKNKDSLK